MARAAVRSRCKCPEFSGWMPRFFTLIEAESLLRDVEATLRRALELKAEYQEAESGLQNYMQRINTMGGTMVDRERFTGQKNRRQESAQKLNDAIEKVHSYGCQIKDLDIGLLDFPTLYHGEEVCLCWKLGENGIDYWHGVTEGFRGRKKIDQEFLEHHQGDLAN